MYFSCAISIHVNPTVNKEMKDFSDVTACRYLYRHWLSVKLGGRVNRYGGEIKAVKWTTNKGTWPYCGWSSDLFWAENSITRTRFLKVLRKLDMQQLFQLFVSIFCTLLGLSNFSGASWNQTMNIKLEKTPVFKSFEQGQPKNCTWYYLCGPL